jgi:hypothetical protein
MLPALSELLAKVLENCSLDITGLFQSPFRLLSECILDGLEFSIRYVIFIHVHRLRLSAPRD